MTWAAWAAAERERLQAASRWRTLRAFDARDPVNGRIDGRAVVSYASNDYLGLTAHPAVRQAVVDAVDRWGTGAGSARLIVGTRPLHEELELELARWKDVPAALAFPSGYMANLAAVTAFAGPEVTVHSDALNHASIIDACRLAGGRVRVYPHLDLDALESNLRAGGRSLVVSESVFSMDGDLAPATDLVALCERFGALLVVDEAHAVLGPQLPGSELMLRVGTLSKALASAGGYLAGPEELVALAVNRARSFIFTTALAPPAAAAALAALRVVGSAEGAGLVNRLGSLVDRVRPGHPSPIVPVVVGEAAAALALSNDLLERGILVPAIRPPTVPEGTSRLRVSLSAAHTESQVDFLRT